MGVGENGAKTWATYKYSLRHPSTKLQRRPLWAKGSCLGGSIELKFIARA
jgi:hypothetical protein